MKRAMLLTMKNGVREHLDQLNEATRMALDDTLEQSQQIREEVLALQRAAIEQQNEMMRQQMESHASLVKAFAEVVSALESKLSKPVSIPRTIVKLEQQPVNVKVDAPVITLPEPSVVIKESDNKNQIRSARITHSDRTQSTIEFFTSK
jgi:hypothetical protein